MAPSTHELDPDGPALNPYNNRCQILSLSGGGYRGLFTAHVLEQMEGRYGPPGEHFDLFAGTSIGAILAGALAVGVPARQCREAMESFGEKIFPPRGRVRSGLRWLRQVAFRAPYSTDHLSEAIKQILGDKAEQKLSEIDKPLLIPCVSHTRAEALILVTKGLARNGGSVISLHDAMLASAAAPTYFPARTLGSEVVIDGGVVANSPELLAITTARQRFGVDLGDQYVLTIGTASPSLAGPAERASRPGVVGWMVGRQLFQVTMQAQSKLTQQQCGALLGNRYLKLDIMPSRDESSAIGLDKADDVAKGTLSNLALRCWEAFEGHQTLARMYQHQARR